MPKCCGNEHLTRFCPHCGKALLRHGIGTLLAHCRSHRDRLARDAEAAESTPRLRMEWGQAALKKWTMWVEALEAVIAEGLEATKDDPKV